MTSIFRLGFGMLGVRMGLEDPATFRRVFPSPHH